MSWPWSHSNFAFALTDLQLLILKFMTFVGHSWYFMVTKVCTLSLCFMKRHVHSHSTEPLKCRKSDQHFFWCIMKIPTLWGKQLQELSKIIFIYQNVRRIDPNLRHRTKFCVKENVIKPHFADLHAQQIASIFWQSGVGMSGPNAWLWAWRLSQPIQGGWGRDDFFQRNHVTTCTWTTETCVTLTKFDVHIELEIQIRSVGTSNWNLNRLPSVCCIKPHFADPHTQQAASVFWQSGVGMSGRNASTFSGRHDLPHFATVKKHLLHNHSDWRIKREGSSAMFDSVGTRVTQAFQASSYSRLRQVSKTGRAFVLLVWNAISASRTSSLSMYCHIALSEHFFPNPHCSKKTRRIHILRSKVRTLLFWTRACTWSHKFPVQKCPCGFTCKLHRVLYFDSLVLCVSSFVLWPCSPNDSHE